MYKKRGKTFTPLTTSFTDQFIEWVSTRRVVSHFLGHERYGVLVRKNFYM